MQYRKAGKTDMSVSVIGLGAEHLDGKPYEVVEETISAAIEQGINFMDVFMPGPEVRKNIGKALEGRRDKMYIQGHIGSVDLNQQYDISRDLSTCKTYFENLLKYLKTDYIDFGMLFFIDSEEDYTKIFDNGIVDYVQSLKKAGTIRAIGASSHNPIYASKLEEAGILDLIMFSINPAFDMVPAQKSVFELLDKKEQSYTLKMDPERAQFYQLCEQHNVAISVMKTLGAGKLLSPEHSPFKKAMSVGQCIHYALTRPAVVSTLIGCQSRAEILDTVKYLSLSDEEKDYSDIIKTSQSDFKGSCVYCNHCLPCPSNINIADVNKYLDIARLNENAIPPSIVQHYSAMEHHASECIQCASCEERCPFSVSIIENMEKAASLFGK
ncbi:MAG: aldo/keto reductase [Spirochaetaceae bacterium]|jgi:predicted aldo/keto reductase-like oxidoreductase|nr:aldo/keto reductase [Spirochaetaceae bacterium]